MLAGHLRESPVVADTFTEASDCLGYDLQELVLDSADARLNRTEFTQPAILTASVALWRLWKSRHGQDAGHAAGHSLGEYSALVAAGALEFSDAVQLVAFRGRTMNMAVAHREGGMAAILGLADEQVETVCANISEDSLKVWPANYNCPGQVVVAGHVGAVEKAMLLAKEAGAKRALSLAVSVPSHTPLMRPAAEAMNARLREIKLSKANRPVWSNASAKPVRTVREIRQALEAQLVQPVLWTQTITNLYNEGVRQAVEMGPGKVLSGLVRRITRDLKVYTTERPEDIQKALISLAQIEPQRHKNRLDAD